MVKPRSKGRLIRPIVFMFFDSFQIIRETDDRDSAGGSDFTAQPRSRRPLGQKDRSLPPSAHGGSLAGGHRCHRWLFSGQVTIKWLYRNTRYIIKTAHS